MSTHFLVPIGIAIKLETSVVIMPILMAMSVNKIGLIRFVHCEEDQDVEQIA